MMLVQGQLVDVVVATVGECSLVVVVELMCNGQGYHCVSLQSKFNVLLVQGQRVDVMVAR